MRVAPELLPILERVPQAAVDRDPVAARERDAATALSLEGSVTFAVPEDVVWDDLTAAGVPVRIYRPARATGVGLVYAHGGGWMTGSPLTVHSTAATLAADSGAVLVSVDYRLIPEHPFPAGVDDVETVFRWAAAHSAVLGVDPCRIVVGGSSAGGNLAAVVSRRLRDSDGPSPAAQLLEAPPLSLCAGEDWETACRDLPPLAVVLENALRAYRHAGASIEDPDAAPLAGDSFENLPPTALLVGEVDPLRVDAFDYAHRLIDAGVRAELHLFPGVVHGTENFVGALPEARRWHRIRCRILREIAADVGHPVP